MSWKDRVSIFWRRFFAQIELKHQIQTPLARSVNGSSIASFSKPLDSHLVAGDGLEVLGYTMHGDYTTHFSIPI